MPREHPLAGVERELKVGPRRRLDLIEEVDADVRALQAELERRGRTPAEARHEALWRLVPDEDVLDQLEARHGSRLQRRIRAARWLDLAVRLGVGAVATLTGLADPLRPRAGSPRLLRRAGRKPGGGPGHGQRHCL